jgi:hypothetical protein
MMTTFLLILNILLFLIVIFSYRKGYKERKSIRLERSKEFLVWLNNFNSKILPENTNAELRKELMNEWQKEINREFK